jgi:glucose/arabinose dehydrogenase
VPTPRRWTAVATLLALPLVGCTSPDGAETLPVEQPSLAATPSAQGDPTGGPEVIGTVASGLSVPWGIDFLPDRTAVVTERDTTRVLTITSEGAVAEIGRLDAASPQGEAGLLGVAVSPDFATDQSLFFYLTTTMDNRVVRTTYNGNTLGELDPILTGIPNGQIHDGGRLEFGPDGMLYVSTGEVGKEELAQDTGSYGGKILRITPDGQPAPDNPFGESPIWSYGHRNIQGLAFDDSDRLWASEFGQNAWDELNLIKPGGNYGWALVEGEGPTAIEETEDLINPQVVWDTDDASPSGLAYADGMLWLAALRGERLWRVDVSGDKAEDPQGFLVGEYGRLRTVTVAPDGNLWVTTSNKDGRGDPSADDDRILLVRP